MSCRINVDNLAKNAPSAAAEIEMIAGTKVWTLERGGAEQAGSSVVSSETPGS